MSLVPGDYLYGWTENTHCPEDHTAAAQMFTLVSDAANKTIILLTCVHDNDYIGTDPEKKSRDDIILGVVLGLVLPIILLIFVPCMIGCHPFWCCFGCKRHCNVKTDVKITSAGSENSIDDVKNKNEAAFNTVMRASEVEMPLTNNV